MAQKRVLSMPMRRPSIGGRDIERELTVKENLAAILWEDQLVLGSSVLAFVLFFVTAIYVVLTAQALPPFLPFFYSLPWGEDQLIPWGFFIASPVLIPIFFLSYLIAAVKLHQEYPVLIRLLFFSLLVFAILLSITVIKIIILFR